MPWKPGLPELIIILVIVMLLFGPGRIGKMAGELGKGIRSFRQGLKDNDETAADKPADQPAEKESASPDSRP